MEFIDRTQSKNYVVKDMPTFTNRANYWKCCITLNMYLIVKQMFLLTP